MEALSNDLRTYIARTMDEQTRCQFALCSTASNAAVTVTRVAEFRTFIGAPQADQTHPDYAAFMRQKLKPLQHTMEAFAPPPLVKKLEQFKGYQEKGSFYFQYPSNQQLWRFKSQRVDYPKDPSKTSILIILENKEWIQAFLLTPLKPPNHEVIDFQVSHKWGSYYESVHGTASPTQAWDGSSTAEDPLCAHILTEQIQEVTSPAYGIGRPEEDIEAIQTAFTKRNLPSYPQEIGMSAPPSDPVWLSSIYT